MIRLFLIAFSVFCVWRCTLGQRHEVYHRERSLDIPSDPADIITTRADDGSGK
jgi:hypothetical protein